MPKTLGVYHWALLAVPMFGLLPDGTDEEAAVEDSLSGKFRLCGITIRFII